MEPTVRLFGINIDGHSKFAGFTVSSRFERVKLRERQKIPVRSHDDQHGTAISCRRFMAIVILFSYIALLWLLPRISDDADRRKIGEIPVSSLLFFFRTRVFVDVFCILDFFLRLFYFHSVSIAGRLLHGVHAARHKHVVTYVYSAYTAVVTVSVAPPRPEEMDRAP